MKHPEVREADAALRSEGFADATRYIKVHPSLHGSWGMVLYGNAVVLIVVRSDGHVWVKERSQFTGREPASVRPFVPRGHQAIAVNFDEVSPDILSSLGIPQAPMPCTTS